MDKYFGLGYSKETSSSLFMLSMGLDLQFLFLIAENNNYRKQRSLHACQQYKSKSC